MFLKIQKIGYTKKSKILLYNSCYCLIYFNNTELNKNVNDTQILSNLLYSKSLIIIKNIYNLFMVSLMKSIVYIKMDHYISLGTLRSILVMTRVIAKML